MKSHNLFLSESAGLSRCINILHHSHYVLYHELMRFRTHLNILSPLNSSIRMVALPLINSILTANHLFEQCYNINLEFDAHTILYEYIELF